MNRCISQSHLFLLHRSLEWIVHEWPDRPQGESIAVVFEQNEELRGLAMAYFREVLQATPWGRSLDSFRFASKKERLPLQAADMLAYETYKHLVNERLGLYQPDLKRPDRRSLLNLVDGRRLSMKYAGPQTLAAFMRAQARGRLQ